ncbi:MAG TPA: tRNA (adenosine(37)-N6)-dimethylallyltransferase MiaA [Candidatus Desulfofervidus auxilii]|uniref:tRNA dimethylallyltransferase n=1 Tax=Desulfofervidus auxilii TaxID=1621989 RepID=A0A7V0IA93_DESA2|nr:tRNA (adenosine(37)-N6)-dimethylallyltransferase MiaA [Candidatus Desulfofervidus auxilii]
MKPKIVILTGPTGVGKTALSLYLAKRFDAEIINADSMQIYRYMDIGTAKPSLEERKTVPHHLIDIKNPDEDYDAAQYRRDADLAIKDILSRGKHTLIVGGTMLYLKVLTKGLFPAPPPNKDLRQNLFKIAEEKGRQWLYEKLKGIDPETARRIKPNDIIRIIRAIEIYELTGRPISWHQKQHNFSERPYDYLKICLFRPREELYQRIEKRVEKMFTQGIIEEVKNLLRMGYTPQLKSMQSIGYRHVIAYLQGKQDLGETKRVFKRDTRRYAKRQLSWFRQEREIKWLLADEKEKIEDELARFWEV